MQSSKKCSMCGGLLADLDVETCSSCKSLDHATIQPTPGIVRDATIAPVSSAHVDESIKQFGDYELLEEIARGGMGVIYKARHRRLNRIAAIKMILSGKFSSPEELQRFHIEAEAAAQLDHPGIVPVYEIGEAQGQAYFAMKYIEGGSLAENLERYRQEPREAVQLLAKVARAVHHAHQRGILHRDLKPANILLDEKENPLLTDLGLAKKTTKGSDLTHTGAVLGTPSYMPPEQASGGMVTTESDTYSLGAILYELLTGRPPYQGSSTIDTVMKVLSESPEPMTKIDPTLDRDLELICFKCLERQPESRYTSAQLLAEDLESWLAGDAISIKPPTFSAQARRWFKKNQRNAYVTFAILMSAMICFPFALSYVGGNMGAVYYRFPGERPPLLFAMEEWLPQWVAGVSVLVTFFALWPSIGFLNAAILQPKTKRRAMMNGIITSSLLALIFFILLGWLAMAQGAANSSGPNVRALANAVWLAEDADPEQVVRNVNSMFGGVEHIPVEQRAEVVSSRIRNDQISSAVTTLLLLVAIGLGFAIPVVYGTVIGGVLLARGLGFWLAWLRYTLAWWALSSFIIVNFLEYVGGFNFAGKTLSQYPWVFWPLEVLLILVFVFSIRRWRKVNSQTHDSVSQEMNLSDA